MADEADSITSEWRSDWPVVVASSLGMTMLGVGYVAVGTFIAPLEQAFGWSRAEISAGFIVFALIGVVLQPPVGMMLDIWGARRLAIPGAALTGMAFALFSTLNGSIIYWLSLWLLLAIVCQLVMATVWTVAISSHFVVNRGRAFAVTMLGSGLAAIGMPLLSNYMIEHQGWRMAYLVTGLGWGGVVTLTSFFMLHERHDRSQVLASASPLSSMLIGYSVHDGIRSDGFIKIFAAILLSNLFYFGLSFHLLPILTWCGLPRDTGVLLISSLGISMIAGTVGYGLIGDRVSPKLLTAILVAMPAITCAMLLYPSTSALQRLIAVSAFGISCGAQLPSYANLNTRYFGMRSFATLSGITGIASGAATAIAPFIVGVIFDRTASYSGLLVVGIPLLLASGLVLLSLGRPPQFEPITV
jgi:MFS family permease